MDNNLAQFISTIGNYGIARDNKYLVILPDSLNTPVYPTATLGQDNRIVSLYAESVDIPGKVINTIATRVQGKPIERPMEFGYSDTLNIEFLVDTRMQVRKYFDDWLYFVYPNGDNVSFSPSLPEVYKKDFEIQIIDYITENVNSNPKEITNGSYKFYGAYPKYISGVQVKNNGRDFQRIKVSFMFDYYTSDFNNTTPTNIVSNYPQISSVDSSTLNT